MSQFARLMVIGGAILGYLTIKQFPQDAVPAIFLFSAVILEIIGNQICEAIRANKKEA
ncbi:MAG: hypothetical protein V4690_01430 [Patescibacteria group bacterium]